MTLKALLTHTILCNVLLYYYDSLTLAMCLTVFISFSSPFNLYICFFLPCAIVSITNCMLSNVTHHYVSLIIKYAFHNLKTTVSLYRAYKLTRMKTLIMTDKRVSSLFSSASVTVILLILI